MGVAVSKHISPSSSKMDIESFFPLASLLIPMAASQSRKH